MYKNKLSKIKHVVIFTWFFPKLSETFILNQIIFLRQMGYKVSIFAIRNPSINLAKEDIEYENIMHESINDWKLCSFTTYNSLEKFKKTIHQLIKAKKIDLIYFQFPDLASEILRDNSLDIAVITMVHDLLEFSNTKNFNNLCNKLKPAFENSTVVLAISQFTAQEIIKLGCPKSKIIVHPMGIDTKFLSQAPFKPIKHKVKLLMIGRFVEKKGLEYGIQAMHKIINLDPKISFQLDIIGDGVLGPKLKNLVSKLNLNKYVIFHGKLSQKKTRQILKNSHVLICPSVTTKEGEREGLPVVILEAITVGIPVIATEHAAIPELARKYPAIDIIPEKSIQGIIVALKNILKEYRSRRYLISGYHLAIVDEYGISNLGKKLINIFDRATKLKHQEYVFKLFKKELQELKLQKILSVFLVGSLAKYENISSYSDIDLVIVFSGKYAIPANDLRQLYHIIDSLKINLGLDISPQIFNEFDIFQMVSPVLLRSYIEDGKLIFGHDLSFRFRNFCDTLSEFEFDLAVFKRMLFLREIVRQLLVTQKISLNQTYNIAKSSLFLAKHFIWLDKAVFITLRNEINKFWNENYKSKFFNKILEFINKPHDTHNNLEIFTQEIIFFIETICDKAYKLLLKKYPNEKINVKSF
jgi:colanic acid/amylovoran biosynthesis glycosyltransferase